MKYLLINTLYIIVPMSALDRIVPYSNNFLFFAEKAEMNLDSMITYLEKIRSEGIHFTNLILSGTEEISRMSNLSFLNLLAALQPFYDLFQYKYLCSNGDIFTSINHRKFLPVRDNFLIKIPRYSLVDNVDFDFFGFEYGDFVRHLFYHEFANFSQARLCFEIICLQNISKNILNTMITGLNDRFQNIYEFTLNAPKLFGAHLNASNIREIDFSNWILNFAHRPNIDKDIIYYMNILSNNRGLEFKDYWEWEFEQKRITMNPHNNLQIRFGNNHIFYGNKQIDYSGNIIN